MNKILYGDMKTREDRLGTNKFPLVAFILLIGLALLQAYFYKPL